MVGHRAVAPRSSDWWGAPPPARQRATVGVAPPSTPIGEGRPMSVLAVWTRYYRDPKAIEETI